MSRPAALSGFPEHLPADRIVEQHVLDTVRRVFELHGFASIETRAVEPLEQMLRKGEIDKEVYVLRRLHAPADEPDAGLGLHFDLTVPLARYVVQNAGHLEFPFRRHQVQKVWRGERPQEGRFREFTQADIDIVGRDTLAFHHEVEVALVMAEVLRALPMPPAVILVNNRRLAEGFFLGAGATDPAAALRAIDKLDKIGPRRVVDLLQAEAGLSAGGARRCVDLAAIRSADIGFVEQVRALGVEHELLEQGLAELAAVVGAAAERMPGRRRRRPEDRAGARLLHGHGLRDRSWSGTRTSAPSAQGVATTRWPATGARPTRASGSRWGYRACSRCCSAEGWCGPLARCRRACSWRSWTRRPGRRRTRSPRRCGPGGSRSRSRPGPTGSDGRSGTPTAGASRSCGSPNGEGGSVKDIRSGEQVPADPAAWHPPEADLHPRVERTESRGEESNR